MQQQRSQEGSYIHKRLIANINLGPFTKTKTLHNSYIYNYMCINTGNSKVTKQNKSRSRVRRFKLFEKCTFEWSQWAYAAGVKI